MATATPMLIFCIVINVLENLSMVDYCGYCGAKMIKYFHRLNKPLVSAMIRIYCKVGLNSIKISEVLSHSQVCNFQKLKYWGLVEKSEKEGFWNLTKLAEGFIKGNELLPLKVLTFRGIRQETTEVKFVRINEIIEGYQFKADYLREAI